MNINVDQFLAGFKAVSKVKRYKPKKHEQHLAVHTWVYLKSLDTLALGVYFLDDQGDAHMFTIGTTDHTTIALCVNYNDLRDTLMSFEDSIASLDLADCNSLVITADRSVSRLRIVSRELDSIPALSTNQYTADTRIINAVKHEYTFKPRKPVQQVKRTFPKHVPIPSDTPIYQSLAAASATHEAYINIRREEAIARQKESKRRSSPFR